MNILEIKDLHTYFDTKDGLVKAVNGVSLEVEGGKTLGVIGESGSGKSQTAMSILKLFESNQSIHKGEILFQGEDISKLKGHELRKIRGNLISMVFQEPMTSLNPVFTVEKQIAEVLMLHEGLKKKEAAEAVIPILKSVKIPNPEKMAKCYPHQLSGGLRQRVMIAMALACKPKLLIADEPTTALDVTIQAQILSLINELKDKIHMSIMFITHDLGVINQIADHVAVMYCGQVVETAPASYIFDKTKEFCHPYTEALLGSMPSLSSEKGSKLVSIEGTVPHPLKLPSGCKFAPRCKFASDKCHNDEPKLTKIGEFQAIRCFYPNKNSRVNSYPAK